MRAAPRCGVLRHGFVRVRCHACGDELLVGFSCKGRGFCPSCNGKQAALVAWHLVDDVLPAAPWRQWTLSLPFRLHWLALKHPRVLDFALTALLQRVWATQRRHARRLGLPGRLHSGAVSFTQYFGSTLQLTPHLHLLLPEAQWQVRSSRAESRDGEVVPVPPPSDEEVTAVLQGFSLHADTAVHGQDRHGLERLRRYGTRGPVAESRLRRREDGRYEYTPKKGVTFTLTAEALVRRLVALVPPPRRHLTSFHGVSAAHAALRPVVT